MVPQMERPFGGGGVHPDFFDKGWHHYAGDVGQATGGMLTASNVSWGTGQTANYVNAATVNQ